MDTSIFVERNKKIVSDYVAGIANKSELGRQCGLSRERVAQIVKKELGKRTHVFNLSEHFIVDWRALSDVIQRLRLRHRRYADLLGVSQGTIHHIFSNMDTYKNGRTALRLLHLVLIDLERVGTGLANIKELIKEK